MKATTRATTKKTMDGANSEACFVSDFEFAGRRWCLSKRKPLAADSWQIVFELDGRRVRKGLKTADAALARERAIKLFIKPALCGDWQKIFPPPPPEKEKRFATLQEMMNCYAASAHLLLDVSVPSVAANLGQLRLVVATALEISPEEVGALSSSVLTLNLAVNFQRKFCSLRKYTSNRLAENRGRVSANSKLRQSRSLFSKKARAKRLYEAAGLRLPDMAGFTACPLLAELKVDNYKMPDAALLHNLWRASAQLKEEQPAVWMVWHLANATGMRRKELCAMRWRWFGAGSVSTPFEEDFIPKSKREREIPVRPDVEQLARELAVTHGWPCGPSDYVLPGTKASRAELFREISVWMKAQGWTRRQKAHELRKIFASVVCEENDAYAAQLVLGHQQIVTTQRYAARPKVAPVSVADRYGALGNVVALPGGA